VVEKQPWYEPSEKLPGSPVVHETNIDFDSVIVDAHPERSSTGAGR
jgi:hypothetical protein